MEVTLSADVIAGPIGSIVAWAKSIAGVPALPAEFQECDGSEITDVDSPMVGEFVPDLNGDLRFLRGGSSSGSSGGLGEVTLTKPEMPLHKHAYASYVKIPATNFRNARFVSAGGFADQSFVITQSDSQGGDGAHENRPPYYGVVWVMRIK